MEATEWAYLAGFIDGEGSICPWSRTATPDIGLHVPNTDRRVLEWIAERFPDKGGINFHRRRKTHRKDYWSWDLTGRAMAPVLCGVLPFLVLKARQAELALLFIETIGRERRLSEETRATRRSLATRLSQLNRRGS